MKLLGFELLDTRNGRLVYINPDHVTNLREGVEWGDWWRESSAIITLSCGSNYHVVGHDGHVKRFLESARSEGTFQHALDEDDEEYGAYWIKLAHYREQLSQSVPF